MGELHWKGSWINMEAGIWSCNLRANEGPQKKLHWKGTDQQTDGHRDY